MNIHQLVISFVLFVCLFVIFALAFQYSEIQKTGYNGTAEVNFSSPKKTINELSESVRPVKGQPTFIEE